MSWAGINNTFFWIDPVEACVYLHLQRQAP
jgi:hypothetical protein